MPPPVSYFTDTQKLNRPWRQRINTLSTAYGFDPNVDRLRNPEDEEEENTPMGSLLGSRNTYGSEIAAKLRGGSGTTSSLRPGGATSMITAGTQAGAASPFINQLRQIGKLGTQSTDIVRARNAFKAAQNVGGGGGFGGGSVGSATGRWGKILGLLKSQLGVPYVWGGEQPGKGFDCSGLVQWAYGRAGIRLPRVSQQQMSRGRRVPIGKLLPGDLVGWGHPATHIAVYIGNGRVIEAPYTGARVRVIHLSQKGRGAWGIRVGV
jgi:cell wall-associated NlpC family hydrolase